jgi:hypothetical protein
LRERENEHRTTLRSWQEIVCDFRGVSRRRVPCHARGRDRSQRREAAYVTLGCLAAAVETGCLCIVGGIAAGGGPIDRGGVECVRRWPRLKVRRRPRLKVRRWTRLKHFAAVMMVVTMHRFLSNGIARRNDRQSDRSDKAFDHGSMFPAQKRRASPGMRIYRDDEPDRLSADPAAGPSG